MRTVLLINKKTYISFFDNNLSEVTPALDFHKIKEWSESKAGKEAQVLIKCALPWNPCVNIKETRLPSTDPRKAGMMVGAEMTIHYLYMYANHNEVDFKVTYSSIDHRKSFDIYDFINTLKITDKEEADALISKLPTGELNYHTVLKHIHDKSKQVRTMVMNEAMSEINSFSVMNEVTISLATMSSILNKSKIDILAEMAVETDEPQILDKDPNADISNLGINIRDAALYVSSLGTPESRKLIEYIYVSTRDKIRYGLSVDGIYKLVKDVIIKNYYDRENVTIDEARVVLDALDIPTNDIAKELENRNMFGKVSLSYADNIPVTGPKEDIEEVIRYMKEPNEEKTIETRIMKLKEELMEITDKLKN